LARGNLTPFSYVVLVLVGRGGASAHDVVRMMRRGRLYWTAADSHYYAEPKRLEQLGLLTSETAPGQTTDRRVYRLTAAGEEAVADWLGEPTPVPRIQNEAIVRLLGSDLGDEAAVVRSLLAMRAELDAIDALLAQGREEMPALPHRAHALELVHRLGSDTIELYRRWLDDVEREYGSG
jgi:PadR family transcriptional regulator, regulatory protein AphA